MKRTIFTLFILLLLTVVYSQENYSNNFGKVTQYEMTMDEFPQDKDAEALVIYETGQYRFYPDRNQGLLLEMTRNFKIKVLKEEGLKYANFEIPYYKDGRQTEEFTKMEATVYNMENEVLKKTSFDKKNMFDEKLSEDIYLKKIALPDVRVGSVIEVKYQITTPFYFHMRKWEFQKKIPVLYSNLEYRAIPYYEYTYILRGTTKFDMFDSRVNSDIIQFGNLQYKEMVYNMGMRNLPAFRDEEFIASQKDYMVAVDFQISRLNYPNGGRKDIISTWPALCDGLLKDANFGKFIKSSEKEAKKILPQLDIANTADEISKLNIITDYVKMNYNWDGFNRKYTIDNVSTFLKKKQGSSAEINLFLVGLLKSAGLKVNPVILSTRTNGLISKEHPFLHFFNYIIAQVEVDGKIYFVDATEPLLPNTELPERCINVEALVIKPRGEEWTTIFQPTVALTNKSITINIDTESQITNIHANYEASGHDAYLYRRSYLGDKDNLKKYLELRNDIQIISEVEINPDAQVEKPFCFSFQYQRPAEIVSNKIYVNPFCNLNLLENPFKQQTRIYPIDLIFLNGDNYEVKINIPEGYKVESLPKELKHEDKIMSIKYSASLENDNTVKITAGYSFNSNIYEAKDYMRIKASVEHMISHFSEMIILSSI